MPAVLTAAECCLPEYLPGFDLHLVHGVEVTIGASFLPDGTQTFAAGVNGHGIQGTAGIYNEFVFTNQISVPDDYMYGPDGPHSPRADLNVCLIRLSGGNTLGPLKQGEGMQFVTHVRYMIGYNGLLHPHVYQDIIGETSCFVLESFVCTCCFCIETRVLHVYIRLNLYITAYTAYHACIWPDVLRNQVHGIINAC